MPSTLCCLKQTRFIQEGHCFPPVRGSVRYSKWEIRSGWSTGSTSDVSNPEISNLDRG